ncbi:MAG: hypothetical protein NC548_27860 [Lachnospiraceae bacterium]|nr:hypothetical protein [Lachnospiraceae bacterium]
METKKMVIVKSKGVVNTSRGRVYAPITRPYKESTQIILRMITVDKADVWEVLPGSKKEVKLSTINYDKNNAVPVPVEPEKEPVVAPPVPKEEVKSDPVDTDVAPNKTAEVINNIINPNESADNAESGESGDAEEASDVGYDADSTYRGSKRHNKNKNKNRNNQYKPLDVTTPAEVE